MSSRSPRRQSRRRNEPRVINAKSELEEMNVAHAEKAVLAVYSATYWAASAEC